MDQGKLNVVKKKKEMERTGVEILGVSELRWTEAGHFESEGHNVYYSSNESTRSKGVAVICTRKMAKAVLGFIPMKLPWNKLSFSETL